MKKLCILLSILLVPAFLSAQQPDQNKVPYKWDDITSPQFVKAVEQAHGVCVIPLGIIQKQGPEIPLGTDLCEARTIGFAAAEKEYAIVFPPYFVGQIFEAKHQPGAVAYSTDLMWK